MQKVRTVLLLVFGFCQFAVAIDYPEEWGANLVGPGSGTTIIKISALENASRGGELLLDGDAKAGSPYCSWSFSKEKPAYVIMKLAESARIGRFSFMNETRTSYQVNEIRMYLSDDGESWEHVSTHNLEKTGDQQTFEVERPGRGSYIKLEIQSTHSNQSYAIMEEFAAFGRAGMFRRGFKGAPNEDLVVMRSGDSLHGALSFESLGIKAQYALLTFSRDQIASISMSEETPSFAEVILVNGDLVTGFIDVKAYEFAFSFGAKADLPAADVVQIGMRSGELRNEIAQHDALLFDNGDLLKGKIKNTTFTLQTGTGEQQLNTAEIQTIEFPTPASPLVRIRMRDEEREFAGYLREESLDFAPDYGAALQLDLDLLEQIEFEPADQ